MESKQTAPEEREFPDYKACKSNTAIVAQIEPSEKIIFSCNLIKFNKLGFRQERTLMLTNLNLYNIKKD
jgi:hypothetical protein